nr:type II toxin-antitoxin system ParD family antitoxin [Mesorhizobium sp. M7A.F.Ca.US.011.01.1.1]
MPNYALNDHYESSIRKHLESGCYNNASEVVRAGLRTLEDFEAEREKWLREEIPGRLTELRQDSSKGIPAETVFSRLEARHRAKEAKAKWGGVSDCLPPRAEAELGQLYYDKPDVRRRRSPGISLRVSATIVSTCRRFHGGHRAGRDHAWVADCWLPPCQHCLCRRGAGGC